MGSDSILKLSIRRRILLLALMSVFFAALATLAVIYYDYSMADDAMEKQTLKMESLLETSVREYTERRAKKRIKDLTEIKAKYLDRELAAAYSPKDLRNSLDKLAAEEHDCCFVLDENGNIVFTSESEGDLVVSPEALLRNKSGTGMAEASRRMMSGESGVVKVMVGEDVYYLAFAPLNSVGWSFGFFIDDTWVQEPAQQAVGMVREIMDSSMAILQQIADDAAVKTKIALILVLLLVFYASSYMTARLTMPIQRLADGVQEIAGGNFDKKLDIRTGDEIEQLAETVNAMTGELKKYIRKEALAAAEQERARTELNVAAQIQTDMLPTHFPQRSEFDIFALMHPAKNVGGDFYDFYLLDENSLVVAIADVSDKGIPAALFMARSQIVLKDCVLMAKEQGNLAAAMENANLRLGEKNDSAMFVTVFLGVLNLSTGHFVYVDGGHCPPLLGRKGTYEFLPMQKGTMLGLVESPYVQQSVDLLPGDVLFLYTDGVSEAMDEQEKQFTESRLRAVLNKLEPHQSAKGILSAVLEKLKKHTGNAEQSDDITMLGLRYIGKS